jgi:hypothetical protein
MSGFLPAIPLYAFMAWTETTFNLTFSELSVVHVVLTSVEQWILLTFVPQ